MSEALIPAQGPVDVNVRPRAWIGRPGNCLTVNEQMACVAWPSLGIGVTPLYAPEDFVADVVGIDNMRELCALLTDLDNIEDPERTPFPAIEDRDWRAHARKCSNVIRLLMRRIVDTGPNAALTGGEAVRVEGTVMHRSNNDT